MTQGRRRGSVTGSLAGGSPIGRQKAARGASTEVCSEVFCLSSLLHLALGDVGVEALVSSVRGTAFIGIRRSRSKASEFQQVCREKVRFSRVPKGRRSAGVRKYQRAKEACSAISSGINHLAEHHSDLPLRGRLLRALKEEV